MLQKDVKVGGVYEVKVNGRLVPVRLLGIREMQTGPRGSRWRYDCVSLVTGRKVTFRSAAKFRRPAPRPAGGTVEFTIGGKPVSAAEGLAHWGRQIVAAGEDEQRPDPTTTGTAATSGTSRAPCAGGPPNSVPAPTRSSAPATPASPATDAAIGPLGAALAARRADYGPPHLIVEARAGTGKTTTLVEGIKVMLGQASALTPSPQQEMVWDCMRLSAPAPGAAPPAVAFVAFNRSIANELKARVPAGCEAMTNHGLGLRAVRAAFNLRGGEGGVSQWRVRDIIAELLGYADSREVQRREPVLLKAVEELVGLCKMNLTGRRPEVAAEYGESTHAITITEEDLDALASFYEVELNGSRRRAYELVPRVLDRCTDVAHDGCVDYDDMIWLPVVLGLPVRKYDVLLVDEAQDLNRCQQALARMAGRRLILCGDPRQAIYGFAGADAESMSRMERELGTTPRGCVTLPLTVTRRCGKAIVEEARKIVPDFEAHESNGGGSVCRAILDERKVSATSASYYGALAADGDMVLCRVNAPLVSECFRFIRAGRKANIQGRDVGKGLIKTVEMLKADNVLDLIGKLDDWLANEQRKESAKRNPSEARLIALQDRHDCLLCFTEGLIEDQAPSAVVAKIEAVFTDDKQARGIRLSSIHKAKGLEARRVFLLEPEGATVPHPMAKSAWQRGQEMNLRYVAITRAIEELVYVS
jgi:DNA helicase II / ATP-dependent DNA helicase PcrA